jgi:hypothetical protein
MSSPHITELRQHLMATLADLRNRENPMEPDRARAVAQVAGVLIESAKVENDYLKLSGQDRSEFLEDPVHQQAVISRTPTANNPFPRTQHQLIG